ncbi:hydroxymethylpyrimidine/phosphomethylpyrimidine kinase [Fructobacillus sp. M158]|uniref:hydroxymethylpyrimidine/phosphomethylpyrimidine kinase n=1 Tax=Fructobacillus parabroussonetiae TaxID=2713174 RepID=UPI00200AC49A|nr:hydroxymethylpyrimidine/phosphomethylpyrimidine kinase [Fructobacillus parabroussonetiae]MCK8616999.1 hydroxymethylpyrimidine/phosphomethylpyrimidine kinase [Fructobacillus parabroussonetiae]
MVTKVLTIAGSDSLSGGGLQTDLATFSAEGVVGFSVISSLALIGPDKVEITAIPTEIFKKQMASIEQVDQFNAIKVGLLQSVDQVLLVSQFLKNYIGPVVVDPVLAFKEGQLAVDQELIDAYLDHLLPLATITTPNIEEALALTGSSEVPKSRTAALVLAKQLSQRARCSLYLKVGNPEKQEEFIDLFFDENGHRSIFRHHSVETANNHGAGCTLSAALTAGLAKGESLHDASMAAADYTQMAIANSYSFSERLAGNVLSNWSVKAK